MRITYLDQTRDTLRPKDTLWEALAPQGGDSLMVQGKQRHVAAYAKDFLFKPDQLRQPVAALSGGERNRLTLAIALAQSTDVLVLDEPTNDLDMQTLDLLEDMLLNFEGTLILVSHDRSFLDATVTSCLVPLGDGQWVETAGGWTDAQSQIKGKPGKATKTEKRRNSDKAKPSAPKKATKLSFKDQHRLKEVEDAMPRLEHEISDLETRLSDPDLFNDDPDAFHQINTRLETARAELEQAELDWMEIEEKKEALAG
ncbi:MAG: ATP-binding cassette domain-containing protein [Pseudomonadota bacterium]